MKITGTVDDLADFDYDGRAFAGFALAKMAATIQSGYNTLSIGGRIFKIQVQLTDSPVTGYQFQFQ